MRRIFRKIVQAMMVQVSNVGEIEEDPARIRSLRLHESEKVASAATDVGEDACCREVKYVGNRAHVLLRVSW